MRAGRTGRYARRADQWPRLQPDATRPTNVRMAYPCKGNTILLQIAVKVNTAICGTVICLRRDERMYTRIRDLREDHDMKQKEVANYLHCSQQVYSNYELGQRDIPTAVLIALANLYGVSIDYLLGQTNRPERNI